MFDILPSSPSHRPRHQRGAKKPALPPLLPRATTPHTIKLSWQLPARLRRPVKQEMARQRSIDQKKKKQNVQPINFTRRPLLTPRPGRTTLLPPYTGRFVQQPKPVTLSPPVQLNILPGKSLPPKKKVLKVLNLLLFFVGCSLILGAGSQLRVLGRGLSVLGSVEKRAQAAYQKLSQAQAALAASDFTQSEQDFAAANTELRQAHTELRQALSASQVVLETLDVSGTIRSGTELLSAGEKLTEAGEHLSRGIAPLLKAEVVSDKGTSTPRLTMVDALSVAQPEFAEALEKLHSAEDSLNNVKVDRLPEKIQKPVQQMKALLPPVTIALQHFLDQSSILMSVLGADHDREYVLVFQNNHEIRPTGGFIGSIALVNVSRGVVEDINVQSVYDPDGQLVENIVPPEPLRHITDRWFLRDANWFVDYSVSARKIADFLEKEKGPTVDGVIAMTPEVIRQLLTVTGPIAMPTYNVTVTPDNFVALTQDEVTYSYDKAANKPKQFLADLTPVLLNKIFTAKEGSIKNLGILSQMIAEKHLMLYFRDEAIQQRVEAAGWAGTLPKDQPALLSVNNANIGGHKSDQFVEQEIDYRLTVQDDGHAEAVVTIRRTHHGPEEKLDISYPAGEDPASKDNVVWQRVMVPQGAELVEATGFTPAEQVPYLSKKEESVNLKADPLLNAWQSTQKIDSSGTVLGTEAGYTFFGNWVVTKPGQTTVALYRYRLPKPVPLPSHLNLFKNYNLDIIKQPGDMRTTIRAELTLPSFVEIIRSVPDEGITQPEPNHLIYRGKLNRDTLLGTLYEKK